METLNKYILGDKYLWTFIALLSLFSFLPVYSASSNLAYTVGGGSTIGILGKHAFFLLVGLCIIITLQFIDFKYFGAFATLMLPIVMVLLVLTLYQGRQIGGANAARWLKVPGIGVSFQTSTLASLVLLIYCARYLTKIRNKDIKFSETILPLLTPIGVIILLILPANGSTAIILFVMVISMLFLGGYPIKYLLIITIPIVILGTVFILFALKYEEKETSSKTEKNWLDEKLANSRFHTWQSRIKQFAVGDSNKKESYQVIHAKAAIARGGQFGQGPGKSALKQTLSQSSSDFIYAIIIEEYGDVGGVGILFIFVMILFRIVIIATKIHTYFGTLLVFAAGLPIIMQAFINMAVAVNLFPVTGQPLPMISAGGTSIWFTCIAFGIILSVSRQIKTLEEIELETKKQSEAVIQDIA